MFAQHIDGSERLQRRNVACARHHNVWLAVTVVASPFPYPNPVGAMLDRRFHVQKLQRGLFSGNNHVHVVPAPQAVVSDGKQAVRIWRQVNPYNIGLLIYYMIDKTRVLMGKAVMVLSPNV